MEDLVNRVRYGDQVEEAEGCLVTAGHEEKRVVVDAVDYCAILLEKMIAFALRNIFIDKSFENDL